MKRFFSVLLILTAIGIYIWDTHLFVSRYLGKNGTNAKIAVGQTVKEFTPNISEVRFVEKGRSPFIAFKQLPKPIAKANTSIKKTASPAVPSTPPPITVSGIMWNPSNPVAIINFSDQSSIVAKTGQTLQGGITVKTIEKNQVEVMYLGKSFILKKL